MKSRIEQPAFADEAIERVSFVQATTSVGCQQWKRHFFNQNGGIA
jgi:hypothetical protein